MNQEFAPTAEVATLLADHGIKPTQQRLEIAAFLFSRPQHVAADQVLVSVARAVEERTPVRGAFRVGGDQFAIILPLSS